MSLDELQSIWKTEGEDTQMRIDREWLLKMVCRQQEDFVGIIFWRDFREVGAAVLAAAFFIFCGLKSGNVWGHPVWTLYLLAATLLWVGCYMVVDRYRRKRRTPSGGEPVTSFLHEAIEEVDHQIWLLRNVFWWYLLPPILGVLCVYLQVFYQSALITQDPGGLWTLRGTFTGVLIFTLLVDAGVYWLNQWCVRKDLMPRREELVKLSENLTAGSNGDSPTLC